MSILTLVAFPVQAALPVAQAAARPLLGLGMLAALLVMFKPLLVGMLRAALLVFKPRRSLAERAALRSMRSALMLNRLARDYEATQPSLAAELRTIAARAY